MTRRPNPWQQSSKFLIYLQRQTRAVLEMLCPEICLLCGTELSTRPRVFGAPVCRSCFLELDRASVNECIGCGAPVAPDIELCLSCNNQRELQQPNELGHIHSLLVYRNTAARLISSWKIGSRRALTPLLVVMLGEFLRTRLHTIGYTSLGEIPIVPVPARPASRIRRGWNPPGSLVRGLERQYGARALHALRRNNKGRQQKSLGREHRLANISGAFELRSGQLQELPPTVILFDDVLTTGATAAECVRVLQNHGVSKVITVVVARDL
ncbi:MAG: ComF family protein [Spirochaetaceae bacterium]|nr:MAG: ComF family protein [Spirochaetaceae bacterium]